MSENPTLWAWKMRANYWAVPPHEKYRPHSKQVDATRSYIGAESTCLLSYSASHLGCICYNYVVRNADCHAKNIAPVIYTSQTDCPGFTPVYDCGPHRLTLDYNAARPTRAFHRGSKRWDARPLAGNLFQFRCGSIPPALLRSHG